MQVVAVSPLLVTFAGSLLIAGGWAVGADPWWTPPTLSLSEAVATRDAGEVTRLVEQEGADPDAVWQVREGLLGPAVRVTPLEAAVLARRGEMAALLLRLGATVPAGEARAAFACLGERAGATEVAAQVMASDGAGVPPGPCPADVRTQ